VVARPVLSKYVMYNEERERGSEGILYREVR
jgi:hypothetical protein